MAVAREIALAPSVDDLARLGGAGHGAGAPAGGRGRDAVRRRADRRRAERPDRRAGARAGHRPGASVGPPPVPFCWLAFGSEARREQTLRTDQDNGLAYADPSPADAPGDAGLLRAPRRRGQRGARPRRLPGVPRADHGLQPGVVPAGRASGRRDSGTGCRGAARRRCSRRASSSISARWAATAELGSSLRAIIQTEAPGARRLLGLLARDVVDRPGPADRLRQSPGGAVRAASGHRRPQGRRRDAAGRGGAGPRARARARGDEHGRPVPGGGGAREVRRGRGPARSPTPTSSSSGSASSTSSAASSAASRPTTGSTRSACRTPTRCSCRDALRTVTRVQAELRERYATDLLQ